MTSRSVADFLTLKSAKYSNSTHTLNVAINPVFNEIGLPIFNSYRNQFTTSFRVQGIWKNRDQEDQSTQFQLFRVPFKDLQDTVSHTVLPSVFGVQSVLPLIYRSYVRLQEYCPKVLGARFPREPKVLSLYRFKHVIIHGTRIILSNIL